MVPVKDTTKQVMSAAPGKAISHDEKDCKIWDQLLSHSAQCPDKYNSSAKKAKSLFTKVLLWYYVEIESGRVSSANREMDLDAWTA